METGTHPGEASPNEERIAGTVGVVRIAGVPVRFHFTFLLLLLFLVVVGVGSKETGWSYVVYVLALFGSVLLHELGHSLVSRRFGIKTIEIVMFPIGGVARLERNPKPREELWISIAGPAVNAVIAAVILGTMAWRGELPNPATLKDPAQISLWLKIAGGNMILAVFNLLPAFPMDGGRILRSILALRRTEEEATRIAAAAGRVLAIALGLYGLLSMNFLLVFVAFFVYLGAAQEGALAVGRIYTQGAKVRAAMVTEFRTLSHGDTIRDAANLLLATSQQDFPVMHGGQVMGLLSRTGLLKALASEGPDAYVAGVMERSFLQVSPDMNLADALQLFTRMKSCALVMAGDQLVGMLTGENLAEYILVRRVGFRPGT